MSRKADVADNGAMTEGKEYGRETYVLIVLILAVVAAFSAKMGLGNFLSTVMNTGYRLVMDTSLYVMAVCVVTGALSAVLAEFGVIGLLQKIISPVMRPIYGLPGVSSLGVILTFLSDNPAILPLGRDVRIAKYFKRYQLPALTNLGTAFGMGLVVTTFMIGLGNEFITPTLIGVAGAIAGSIVSTRIMLFLTKRHYKKDGTFDYMNQYIDASDYADQTVAEEETKTPDAEKPQKRGAAMRLMMAMLDGGKSGVDLGFSMIPGMICICTPVLMLTNGPSIVEGVAVYTGAAFEGVALFPKIGALIAPVIDVLFGFQDPGNIAVPITALGSAGASLGTVSGMVANGTAGGNEIAIFTSMCMCWSGYLATHASMMDSMNRRELIGSAIGSHTIGGLAAGMFAHYLYLLVSVLT